MALNIYGSFPVILEVSSITQFVKRGVNNIVLKSFLFAQEKKFHYFFSGNHGDTLNVLFGTYRSTLKEEHAIQMDLFVYTRFHSRNIYSNYSPETNIQTYTHIFSLKVTMVGILPDLNWK